MQKSRKAKTWTILLMAFALIILAAASIFIGSSRMTLLDGLKALLHQGTAAQNRIIWNIRIPRVLAAVIAGVIVTTLMLLGWIGAVIAAVALLSLLLPSLFRR